MLQNSAFWSYKSMKLKYAEKYKPQKKPRYTGLSAGGPTWARTRDNLIMRKVF